MGDDIKLKLQILQANYLKELPQKLDKIEQQWRLLHLHFDKFYFKHFHQAAHSMCGSLATYGYTSLSKAMRDLEIYLQQLLDKRSLTAVQESEISHLVEHIRDIWLEDNKPRTESLVNINEIIESKLIVYFTPHEGKFERVLKRVLGDLDYTLILLKKLSEWEAVTKNKLPVIVIIDEYYFEDEKIACLEKCKQSPLITMLCVVENDSLRNRLHSIRLGASIFLHKPVDVFYLTHRLVQISELSIKSDYRILILDDSEPLAAYYTLVLEEAGMQVRSITKPVQLLQELQDFNPNILLMDLYLPECKGSDLAKMVRQEERYASLPIIFVSRESDRYKQLAILNSCGGDDFLTKPVLPQNLVAAVKSRAQRSALLYSYIAQDSLTSLLNHSYILSQLKFQLLRAHKLGRCLSIAMIDLDGFKQVNDKYGHPVGDMVLKKTAGLLSRMIRHADFIGRYGGEEFIIIFPNTDMTNTIKLCNKICKKHANTIFEANGDVFFITLSIGVAEGIAHHTLDSLVAAADKALYNAKSKGRNRVEF